MWKAEQYWLKLKCFKNKKIKTEESSMKNNME